MRTKYLISSLAATVCLTPVSTMANGLFENGHFIIGGGYGYSSGVYKGEKSEGTAFPFLSYETERLSLGLGGISYSPIVSDNFEFTLSLGVGETPDFPKNDPLFAGLKRGTAIEGGFGASYDFGGMYVSGNFMHDISSEHKGYHIQAKVGAELEMGPVNFDLGIGGRMRDKKLNNFLYGVSASEATGARAAYDVGRTIEPFVEATISMSISDRVAIVGVLEYQALDKKVHNSPLVGRDDTYSVGLGLVYQF